MKKSVIIFFTVLIVLITGGVIFGIVWLNDSTTTIDRYLAKNLQYNGYNGYGTASADKLLGYSALSADMRMKKIEKLLINKPFLWNLFFSKNIDKKDYSEEVKKYFTIEFKDNTKNGHLKNGDKVEIIIRIDIDGIKADDLFNTKISGKSTFETSFTVMGLKEPTVIDVFDTVNYYINDTTMYHDESGIVFQEDYSKTYSGDITVSVSNNKVEIYKAKQFSIIVEIVKASGQTVPADAQNVRLKFVGSADTYINRGILLSPTEKDVSVTNVRFAGNDNFNSKDMSVLLRKATAFAKKTFASCGECTNIREYIKAGTPTHLAFFFDVNDGSKNNSGYRVAYYDCIKLRSDTGDMYKIDSLTPKQYGQWKDSRVEMVGDFRKLVFPNGVDDEIDFVNSMQVFKQEITEEKAN